jgi:hypothetical protein
MVDDLAKTMVLGALLDALARTDGGYELVDHWQQGEFHHDTVLALRSGGFLVVATNCNGGIKEVLRFDSLPDRWALWHHRCPDNPEFVGALPAIRERAITDHWFDPCALLLPDARSELRAEHRSRMRGGGWCSR